MGVGATRGAGTGMPSAAELAGLSRAEKLALLRRLAQEESARGGDGAGRDPASFAQRRLWFLDRLEPGGSHNTIFRAVRLRGRLDRQALGEALRRIVERHEALRTRFEEADGEPVQVIEPAADRRAILARVDLARLPAAERERRVAELARAEAAAPFDLGRAPLARFTLVDLGRADGADGADRAVLFLAVHHIVADGWSLGILLRELSVLYGALRRDRDASPEGAGLPELETGYGTYARSQRERLSGAMLEREIEHWRERLGGAPTVLDLPTDRPRPALASFRGAIEPFELGPELAAGVRDLARSERATPFMVLLAAFAAALARWTGRDDLLVGTPVAGRPRSELEPLIGFFANTLVLRADLRGRPSFREAVRRIRAQALGAFGQQEMPFERLVEVLEEDRDLSRNPLYQVMFALQNQPAASLSLDGLEVAPMPVERGLSKVDLTLDLVERGGALLGYLEYTTALFDRTTVRRLAGAIRRSVSAGVAEPDRPVLGMPSLGAAERHALTVEWQGAESPGRSDGAVAELPVHRAIARRAATAPERTAVEVDGTSWSYGDLDRAAARIAAELAALGVATEDRVGVLAPRSVETIAAFLGVLRAGAAYVPLDPEYPDDRLGFMAADAAVRAVLFPRDLAEGAARAGRIAPDGARRVELAPLGAAPLPGGAGCGFGPAASPAGSAAPPPDGWRRRAAYVIYTSGTTGRPKGVVVSHGALANHAAAVAGAYDLGPDDRVLQFASMSFDIAGEEIYPSLARGAALVLRTPALSLEPRGLVRFVAERRLSVVNLPTPLWHEWCRELELAAGRQHALVPPAGLRLVIVGTEGAQPERLRAWLDALERAGRSAPRWINAYGPTEATVTSTLHAEAPRRGRSEDAAPGRVPIGRPIAGLRAYVLDPRMEPVPVGSAGELCLGGAGIARGYLGRPSATAAVFVPDPFAARRPDAGGRLYRTGDLARVRPDGAIEFLGRTDDQVKIRGFRIEPGEVEAALAGHPELREVAVVARGAGSEAAARDRHLVAYVVPRTGRDAPPADLLAGWLLERLPAYMVPAAFVPLPVLPLTPAGKVDRERLPEPDLSAEAAGGVPYAPPRTPSEAALAEIWSDVLEIERIGVDDDFFRLGGHSLLATRVISRVRDRLGVELPLRALFEARTVAALAPRLGAAAAGTGLAPFGERPGPLLPPIGRLERREGPAPDDVVVRAPLSFAQQRLWFLDRLEPGRAIYNVPAALRLETGGVPLDTAALRRALEAIVRRHESLRTTFAIPPGTRAALEREDGAPPDRVREPLQLVHGTVTVPFRHHDLTALPRPAAEAEARRLGALEGAAPFDLERGPLARFRLLSLPAEGRAPEHRLLATFHHIVADGWSIDVFSARAGAVLPKPARRGAGRSIRAGRPAGPLRRPRRLAAGDAPGRDAARSCCRSGATPWRGRPR